MSGREDYLTYEELYRLRSESVIRDFSRHGMVVGEGTYFNLIDFTGDMSFERISFAELVELALSYYFEGCRFVIGDSIYLVKPVELALVPVESSWGILEELRENGYSREELAEMYNLDGGFGYLLDSDNEEEMESGDSSNEPVNDKSQDKETFIIILAFIGLIFIFRLVGVL